MNTIDILHKIGENPPKSSPITPQGAEEWREWSESCRELEKALEKFIESEEKE